MKFTIFTAAAILASGVLAQDLTCPTGQEICGSGCITGTCCSAETALYCQPGEYCTVIDGVQGCCPEGSTCTSKRQCSDFNSPRCTGANKDEMCCTEDLPYCDTVTTTCVAEKPSEVLGEEPTLTATSTTQVAVTVEPTSTLSPATPAPQPEEAEKEEEEEEEVVVNTPVEDESAIEVEELPAEKEVTEEVTEGVTEEEEEEEWEEPITRTNTNYVTSTTSLPVCGAAPTDVITEPECETYTYTKVVPISTIWVDVPAPSSETYAVPAPSSETYAVPAPSTSKNATTKSIVMQTPSPSSTGPAQFTGAASTVKGGMMGIVVAVFAGLMML